MSKISESILGSFSNMVGQELGLHYPKERHQDLIDILMSAFNFTSVKELETYMSRSLEDNTFKQVNRDKLSEALTIGETYYFRNGCGFEELEKSLLPELIQQKATTNKTIRIWSAGCSQGDEPNSIAILLDKLLPSKSGWTIQILGTDINKKSLEKAQKGVVRRWSFRNLGEEYISTCFTRVNELEFQLLPKIHTLVSYAYLNLIEDYYPSLENGTNGLDIILCNNTLMYFSQPQIQKCIRKFINCLLPNGYFIISPTEAAFVNDPALSLTHGCNVFSKKKKRKKQETATAEKKQAPPPPSPKAPIPAVKPEAPPIKPTTKAPDVAKLYEEGDYEGCLENLKGKTLNDENASIAIRSYANLGQIQQAESLCKERLEQNSLNQLFHFLLANLYQEQNKTEEAILELKRALFLDSDYIMAHFSLAYLLHIQKKIKESEVHKRVVLEELNKLKDDSIVPGSEHILVSRLKEMITNMGDI